MASTSEVGHAENVGSFNQLISVCEGFGTSYNPSNTAITVPNLKIKFTDSDNAIKAWKEKKTAFLGAINARNIVMGPMKKLSTRILNAFSSCGANSLSIADLKELNRKIQGKRADMSKIKQAEAAVASGDTTGVKIFSVSQQNVDKMIENFLGIITMLKAEPLYNPNEDDLKITALETYLTSVIAKNNAVNVAKVAYDNSLISRDAILYDKANGLVILSKTAKLYVKSVYGASSPEFRKVNTIRFRGR